MSYVKIDPLARHAASRRLAAVLAGGLVLGLGAVTTAASWHDSELTSVTFSAGRANPVVAVDQQALRGPAAAANLTTRR